MLSFFAVCSGTKWANKNQVNCDRGGTFCWTRLFYMAVVVVAAVAAAARSLQVFLPCSLSPRYSLHKMVVCVYQTSRKQKQKEKHRRQNELRRVSESHTATSVWTCVCVCVCVRRSWDVCASPIFGESTVVCLLFMPLALLLISFCLLRRLKLLLLLLANGKQNYKSPRYRGNPMKSKIN